MAKLRKLDRPVVLVFFGDHQPFFPDKYNNRWFTNEDKAEHNMRLWTTDYLIWANYDVAGNDQDSHVDNLSTNYLGTEMMNIIGAPLNDYQKAQLTLRSALPAINTTGYLDATGTIYLSSVKEDESGGDAQTSLQKALQARSEYATIQVLRALRRRQGCVHQASPERRERDRPEPRARYDADQVARAKGREASARPASAYHDVKTLHAIKTCRGFAYDCRLRFSLEGLLVITFRPCPVDNPNAKINPQVGRPTSHPLLHGFDF
ncbi:MAG: hypothetical protein ACLTSX_04760 [Collinsella sp.]